MNIMYKGTFRIPTINSEDGFSDSLELVTSTQVRIPDNKWCIFFNFRWFLKNRAKMHVDQHFGPWIAASNVYYTIIRFSCPTNKTTV